MIKFKKGDSVLINKYCEKTKREYGMGDAMLNMMGKEFKITEINNSESVFIKSYTWHISDLKLLMNSKDFKIGAAIKICQDPIKSIKNFGGTRAKKAMAGTVQKIVALNLAKNAVIVKKDGKGMTWTIHIDDIIINQPPLPKIKPELFNPNQLVF